MEDDPSKSPPSTGGFVGWLRKEMKIKRELVPIKLVTFLYQGGVIAYMPYLTLHMMGIGISMQQVAFTYAVMPIASLIGPPVAGILADRFGNYKLVLMLCMFLCAGFHQMLLAVPYSEPVRIDLSCGSSGHNITWGGCHQCIKENNHMSHEISLQDCKLTCSEPDMNVDICYGEDICTTYNSTLKVSFNVSIGLDTENDGCSFSLNNTDYINESRQPLTCNSHCHIDCQISENSVCGTKKYSAEYTFWVYFVTRITATLFLGPCFTMLDASALALSRQYNGDFGKQKITGNIGAGLLPLFSGLLIDYHSDKLGYQEYMSAFYLGNSFVIMAIICLAFMTIKVETQPTNFFADLKKLVSRLEINIFLIMILLIGTFWGFLEMFLFILLKKLKAPNYLMGLTMTVGFGVSLPFLFTADAIVEKVGRPVIFTLSFLMYGVRLIGYSLITNPWMCLPYEFLEVITFQLTWIAAVTYCPTLAPRGLMATMTGLIGATHYAIGRGLGSSMGGFIIGAVGIQRGFQVFGLIAIGGGCVYALVHHLFLKKKIEQANKNSIGKSGKKGDDTMWITDSVMNGNVSLNQEKSMSQPRLNTIQSKYSTEDIINRNFDEHDDNEDVLSDDQPMLLRGISERKTACIVQQNERLRNGLDSNNCV